MVRPVFFYVVFWGEQYRQYFCNVLLRSLLAPGNLPRLDRSAGHKFLICCPGADWAALQSHPAAVGASRYLELVHVLIEPPSVGVNSVEHMAEGHSRAAAMCQEARAIGSLLHPDMVFADGFVASLERYIASHMEVVLAPALRLAETPLFASLSLNPNRESGEPLVLRPRKVAAAVIASLHDEIIECEMHGPRLSMLPNCVWWRNRDRGLLVHSFTWSPLLIDHAAISEHVLDGLRGPIPDGDYIARNFSANARIAFVGDSDDIAFASWTPDAVGARERRRSILQNLPILGRALRDAILRRTYLHYTRDFYPFGDHIKAKGFQVPLKIHIDDLDVSWNEIAVRADRDLAVPVGDLFEPPIEAATWRTTVLDRIIPALKPYEFMQRILSSSRFVMRRLVAALRGDSDARNWIVNRVRARVGL